MHSAFGLQYRQLSSTNEIPRIKLAQSLEIYITVCIYLLYLIDATGGEQSVTITDNNLPLKIMSPSEGESVVHMFVYMRKVLTRPYWASYLLLSKWNVGWGYNNNLFPFSIFSRVKDQRCSLNLRQNRLAWFYTYKMVSHLSWKQYVTFTVAACKGRDAFANIRHCILLRINKGRTGI